MIYTTIPRNAVCIMPTDPERQAVVNLMILSGPAVVAEEIVADGRYRLATDAEIAAMDEMRKRL